MECNLFSAYLLNESKMTMLPLLVSDAYVSLEQFMLGCLYQKKLRQMKTMPYVVGSTSQEEMLWHNHPHSNMVAKSARFSPVPVVFAAGKLPCFGIQEPTLVLASCGH